MAEDRFEWRIEFDEELSEEEAQELQELIEKVITNHKMATEHNVMDIYTKRTVG